jgi:hypothetical protein
MWFDFSLTYLLNIYSINLILKMVLVIPPGVELLLSSCKFKQRGLVD